MSTCNCEERCWSCRVLAACDFVDAITARYDSLLNRYLALWGLRPFENPREISWRAFSYSFAHGIATGFCLFAPMMLFWLAFGVTMYVRMHL